MLYKKNLFRLFYAILLVVFSFLPAGAEIRFTQSQVFDVGFRPSHLDTGDVNGDGFDDIVIANMMNNSISVAYNNGKGTFETITEIPYLNDKKNPTSVAVGDIDGDGKVDIATSQIQDILNATTPFQNGGLVLFFNKGDGTFDQAYMAFDGMPSMILIRDADKDGKNDLIVSDNGEQTFDSALVGAYEPGLTIYKNKGNRQFELSKNIVTEDSLVYSNYTDYNNDTYPDIVSMSQGHITINEVFQIEQIGQSIEIFNGSAAGFPDSPTQKIDLTQNPWTSYMADMDNDGKEDLVVAMTGEMQDITTLSGKNASIDIYHNTGKAFEYASSILIEAVNYQVIANDFDKDGDMDIAVSQEVVIPQASGNEYKPYMKFYENDGKGNFKEVTGTSSTGESQPVFAVDRLPRYAASGDFDKDGNLDIAVLCSIKDAAEFGTSAKGQSICFPQRQYHSRSGMDTVLSIPYDILNFRGTNSRAPLIYACSASSSPLPLDSGEGTLD